MIKFNLDATASRPSTPHQRPRLGTVASRPATPNHTPARAISTHALHPKQPVQTPQQFYDWFSLIDRSVAHSQEAHFRAHVAGVAGHLESCDSLVERIEEVDKEIEGMLEGWRGVEEGGRNLKNACEKLLQERVCFRLGYQLFPCFYFSIQDELLTLTEEIDTRLEYFQELERATRMLNHPGESLVLQTDFLYMVERVDICIDYLKDHVRSCNHCLPVSLDQSLTASLPRGRSLPASLPAMYDSINDSDKDVLCRFSSDFNCRRLQATIRKSKPP